MTVPFCLPGLEEKISSCLVKAGRDPRIAISSLNIASFLCYTLLSVPDPPLFPGAPRILAGLVGLRGPSQPGLNVCSVSSLVPGSQSALYLGLAFCSPIFTSLLLLSLQTSHHHHRDFCCLLPSQHPHPPVGTLS